MEPRNHPKNGAKLKSHMSRKFKKHIMKKINILLFVFAAIVTFSSCKKEEKVKPAPTRLQITVRDELGNAVSGSVVKLYATETDWENETNQVGSTQVSDASGVVTFSDLSAIKYYWFAEKNCQNNANGGVTTTAPLASNITTTVNAVLSSTGTLTFQNTSTNPYRVFVNSVEIFTMNGKTSEVVNYVPTGSYSIRVLQVSGYAVYPTDETYTGTVGCGQTLQVIFPD